MSQFQDVQVSGLLQAGSIVGATISDTGSVLAQDNAGSIALVTGNNDDVPCPSLRVPGATVFKFTSGGTAALRSIKADLPVGEFPPTNSMIVIQNANAPGGAVINTTANTGGTAGNRFSVAVELAGSTAMWCIYDGVHWCPLFPVVVPG